MESPYIVTYNKINLLFAKCKSFLEILKNKKDWSKVAMQYALQIMYFLHCGYVLMTTNNNNDSFKQFVDNSNNTQKLKDFEIEKNYSFTTYKVQDAIIASELAIQTIDIKSKDHENRQINKASYLAIELIIQQKISSLKGRDKNKKRERDDWIKLMDKLRSLDSLISIDCYIRQVLLSILPLILVQ
jgi:hypothetical protein